MPRLSLSISLLNPMICRHRTRIDGFPTREQVTYSYQFGKHGYSESKPQMDSVWPCALFMGKPNESEIKVF